MPCAIIPKWPAPLQLVRTIHDDSRCVKKNTFLGFGSLKIVKAEINAPLHRSVALWGRSG